MFKQLLISTAFATALVSTPLLAQGTSMGSDNPKTTGQQRSGPNDAGGQAGTSEQGQDFDEFDLNKDGVLDEDELNRYGATAAGGAGGKEARGGDNHAERMLKMYDHDDDGTVSQPEIDAGARSMD